MELLVISALLFSCGGLLGHEFLRWKMSRAIHLPDEIKEKSGFGGAGFGKTLSRSSQFTEQWVKKTSISSIENLRRKLISAGRPISVNRFFIYKFLLTVGLPSFTYIVFRFKQPTLLVLAFVIGFSFADIWLNNKIKKRHLEVLRSLPHVIDLLNICVGAGLDFMMAVTRVIEEFQPGVLVEEFKIMAEEINMGSSRREALNNLSYRIGSPEIISFVRTLLQADRMGTPIGEVLRMQAEEMRIRRFQKGEEMALKAPIKLLFPLLFFILPVVLIIVAGPILIQFTRGTMLKF